MLNEGGWTTTGLNQKAIENLERPLARRVYLHEEVGSTQERARELARRTPGAPHGTLVISRVQKGGRGRLGRAWGSPPGGLWMSLVLRPEIPVYLASRITQAAAVGVAKALWDFGVEARIKWPNDLLVVQRGDLVGRKICGILAEAGVGDTPGGYRRLDFVILGIGLNANLDPEDLAIPDREVATLRSELGRDVDLTELLDALLSRLNVELERIEDFSAVLEDWRALNCTLGKLVRVERFGEALEGRASDLTPEGALLLDTPEGTVEVFEGEVEHLRQEGT
jgi:BirA family transcriptional regulator, biotin operon repressor / biotin---[acetyl-CoA-carboxylase] ligase